MLQDNNVQHRILICVQNTIPPHSSSIKCSSEFHFDSHRTNINPTSYDAQIKFQIFLMNDSQYENLAQDRLLPGQDSNPAPRLYEASVKVKVKAKVVSWLNMREWKYSSTRS
jgi:hypothetical protein